MCGILGYLARSPDSAFRQQLDLLKHRGPDGRGEVEGRIGAASYWLGHRRLSIIDVEGGAQPLEKHNLVVTFNGEIYNYVEIASELKRHHGVVLQTRSDTEVLLEAFRAWGARCVDRLNGMWAFAILNKTTGELFCSRDRLGKKPFYYVEASDGFYFGSEPHVLLGKLPRVRADNSTLVSYLLGGEMSSCASFFDGVKKLPAGHSLTIGPSDERPHLHRYWVAGTRPQLDISYEDACSEIQRLLADAVAIRMRSDVGFGVAASGGLDSTIILETAARQSAKPVRTVSVTFDEAFAWDETKYIEALRDHFPVEPTYAQAPSHISLDAMLDEASASITSLSEPTAYTSVPYVSKLYEATAKAGLKVLLEGQGADELFGGYPYFTALQTAALLRRWTTVYNYLLASRIKSPAVQSLYFHLNTFLPFLASNARDYLRRPHLNRNVHEALLQAQAVSILPDLLQYSDRLSMRWGVEVRLPFLDYRLVELVNSLPTTFKVWRKETKRVLRDAFSERLPTSVLTRPKVGFGSPTLEILGRNFGVLTQRYLKNGHVANSALFKNGLFGAARSGFLRTLPNWERVLWRFMLVDMWIERFNVEVSA
jgi:asparagine synthase (glutamine-hydrolysing)